MLKKKEGGWLGGANEGVAKSIIITKSGIKCKTDENIKFNTKAVFKRVKDSDSSKIKRIFKEAVRKMYGIGFLYSDLRDLNILYQIKKIDNNDDVEIDIKIVDYYWVGRIDHAIIRYFLYLNPKIERHYDAHSGCQIK
ncbi:10126_t:CDS:2 [Funneliformis caledonium]|uniref:10126_t:CDS:1 n=1 Tax=Funneliformis caledonium TaxID=1117310 RepID=A0A9N8ZGF6_9GLOM|nr:10126_t:CDS:2 [Funneliformis caledonium]